MKVLLFAHGSGETSHVYAIAKILQKHKIKINIAIKKPETKRFLASFYGLGINHYARTPLELEHVVNRFNPDVVIFCNSKLFRRYAEFNRDKPPYLKRARIYTVDTNWLFNTEDTEFRFIQWADAYLIAFPKEIFNLGLKKNGGYFQIDKLFLERMTPIGLIPSFRRTTQREMRQIRKSYGATGEKKLIFCYFSGFGAEGKPWILENLVNALKSVDILNSVRIICSGNFAAIKDSYFRKHPSLVKAHFVGADDFYHTLASSDLVFQHQGLATLAQAISVEVPVIANVRIYRNQVHPGLHPAEIEPFAKLNLCRMFYKSSAIEDISDAIYDLLYGKKHAQDMKTAQAKLHTGSGEEEVLRIISKKMS